MYKSIQYFNEKCAKKFENLEDEFIKDPADIASYIMKLTEELHHLGIEMIKETLEDMDEMLNESAGRKRKWVVDRHEKKTLITSLGAVNFRKTLFKNKETSQRSYLLDTMLGMKPGERMTEDAEAKLSEEAVQTSYRRGGEAASLLDSVSKQTTMNKLHRLRFPKSKTASEKKYVRNLYIDADEDHIALQYRESKGDLKVCDRGRKNNGIIAKLVYVYEGIEPESAGSKRNRLINPHYFSRTSTGTDNKSFWDEVFDYIEKTYDVGRIEKIYLNGDGGNWMREGRNRLPEMITTVDEFHLQKYLLKLSGHMKESKEDVMSELRRIITKGTKREFVELTDILTEYLDSQEEVGKRRIEEASKYVLNNWMPAKTRLSYKGILPGCSAEGHVSHVLSARMSSLPKGWSQKGADAMAQLRAYYYNHGDMLELVKYQKEEEPKAVGNEGTFYSVTDIMSSERSRHGQMGKYFDSMQTRLTLDTRKKIYFNSNMKFL